MKNISDFLIIFDENININSLRTELSRLHPIRIELFPLTSNWRLIYDLENATRSLFDAGVDINLIESSEVINKEVDIIREKVSKWSADLGNYNIAGKSIKEWFLLPKGEVSTWWFSIISEKNTSKTDVFFRLAQLQAIDKIFASNSYDPCFVSVSEKKLRLSIKKICKRNSADVLYITSLKRRMTLNGKLKSYFNREKAICFGLKALIHFVIRILRATRAKLVMGSIKNRVKKHDNSVLFVSYFPAVDKKSAKKGILKNKYAIPLQKKLSEMGKKIIWIWMYEFLDEHSYSDALTLAKNFKKKAEVNFFLDEFMSFKIILRVLSLWIRQFRTFLKLIKLMPTQVLYKNFSIPEGAIFIKNLMARSFIGWTGLAGILFFELYKKVFSCLPHPSHCIYYLEMQAWEKALNAAKQLKTPQIKSIGFQHGAIYRNDFYYLIHPSEVIQKGKSTFLPFPDILACNGDIPLHLMSYCRYPDITKVEAVRHLYLTDYLNNFNPQDKQDIVLIAGSTDIKGTKAIISLFYETFPKPKRFKVWLKGHPTLPVDIILKDLRINIRSCGYMIKLESMDKLIKPVKILITGSSTVAIEGVAGGCKVIAPIFSDHMFLNPLHGFEEFYSRIHNPQELRTSIEQTFQGNGKQKDFSEVNKFISRYWCLDPSLKRWEAMLKEK